MIGYGGFPATSRRAHGPAKPAPTRVRTGFVGSKDAHLCQGGVRVQNPGPRLLLFVARLQFSSTLQPYQSFLSRTVPPNVATFWFERVFRVAARERRLRSKSSWLRGGLQTARHSRQIV